MKPLTRRLSAGAVRCNIIKLFTSFTLVATVLVPIKAFACSCIPQPDNLEFAVKKAFEEAASVVLARAESIESTQLKMQHPGQGEDFYLAGEITLFSEINSWKGNHGEQFHTNIVTECCVCGVSFTAGETYLLYLYKENEGDIYGTSICHRTSHVSRAKPDIEILEALAPKK